MDLLYISCSKLQTNSLFINGTQILTDTHRSLQNFSWLPVASLVMKHCFIKARALGKITFSD